MATGNSKYKTLDAVVNGALMDIYQDMSRYDQFLHWGIKGLREWHSDIAREVKTVVLTMDDTKKVDFPSDFVDYTKVGIKCGNVIKTFVHDEKLTFHNGCIDGVPIPNSQCSNVNIWDLDTAEGYEFYNHQDGDYPMFGLAYQSNGLGYFRVHWDEAQIQFRTVIPANSQIILEYISDGWDPTKSTLLHPYAVELITLFIHWQNAKYNSNTPLSRVEMMKQEYFEEYQRVAWKMDPLTVEDVLEVSRESFRQTVKS